LYLYYKSRVYKAITHKEAEKIRPFEVVKDEPEVEEEPFNPTKPYIPHYPGAKPYVYKAPAPVPAKYYNPANP